jgi:hypothetical protein
VDAASAARKKDRTAEITLITNEAHAGYSRCGLPFVIDGQIPKFTDLIVYSPAYFQMLKLNLKTETTVTAINLKETKTPHYTPKATAPQKPCPTMRSLWRQVLTRLCHPLKALKRMGF